MLVFPRYRKSSGIQTNDYPREDDLECVRFSGGNMSRISQGTALGITAALLSGAGLGYGQATNSGDIRGTVTDSSGAVIPDVSITVTNLATGVVRTVKTNGSGLYDSNSIVVGAYEVRFEKEGFQTFERSRISLQVGDSTLNAVLKVGSVSDTVTVNSDLPLLQTDSGTQQTTLEAHDMEDLPNVGQDWQNFAITLPGSAGYAGSTNPGQGISANGNLPYNNVLSDGSTTTLGTSQNSDVNVFETVQEVQISTSAFSAQYGIGGIIFNQISKGGTRDFHGSAYEYFQSNQFNANTVYAALNGGKSQPNPPFHYNNFGASIGGPIWIPKTGLRDKAFFYFDYDQIINHGTAHGANDIPTPEVMAGDFSSQTTPLYDPTTQTIGYDKNGNPYPIRKTFLSEYGKNAIPQAMFDKVAANFQKFYPTPSNHIAGGQFVPGTTDALGITHQNFYAVVPQSSPSRRIFGRLDLDLTPKNRISVSVTSGDAPATAPSVVTASPIGWASQDVTRLNVQGTDVFTVSSNFVNEFRLGFTYQGNFFGDLSLGKGFPQQLGWQYSKADEIPGVQFYTNYPYAWIQPSGNQYVYKENVIAPSDVVTLVKGKHILHFGGEVDIYRNDNTPYGQINPGTLGFSGNYTGNYRLQNGVAQRDTSTGADYADFLLGYANNWSAQNGSEYGARLKSPQFFVQDDYKVRPNLTLNLGVRYQVRLGISEVKGNVGTYDPTVLNPANNQLGAYWFGATAANGRTSLENNKYSTVLPRVGFSYLPYPTMTIRGGFGVYAYNLSIDTYGGGLGNVQTSSGNGSDNTNGTLPYTLFGGPGTVYATGAPLPYATPGTSPTRFNGQNASYTQYDTPDPKIYQWNFGIQQMMGSNTVFDLSYVASHGFDLNFGTDLNQVPVEDNIFNNSKYRPNQNYIGINGSTNNGFSNFNSLQAQMTQRMKYGLSYAVNYTWSHFLDTGDSSGWGSHSGVSVRQYQDAASNYSDSNFDLRNQLKGRVVYELPVGRGRQFFNHNTLVDEIFGGYQVAATIQLASGNPFSVISPISDGSEPGQNHNPFPDVTGRPFYPNVKNFHQWFDPAAFAMPSALQFGNARRNLLRGPGTEIVNLSAGKKFDIYEKTKLQIRVDATNALNHPNFYFGSYVTLQQGSTTYGQPFSEQAFGTSNQTNSLGGLRTVQAGARLEF